MKAIDILFNYSIFKGCSQTGFTGLEALWRILQMINKWLSDNMPANDKRVLLLT
jgi:hypothetical protein